MDTLIFITLLWLSQIATSLLVLWAYLYYSRHRQTAATRTPLSPTGHLCEACNAPALPHRTHDGRWLCAAHKGKEAA